MILHVSFTLDALYSLITIRRESSERIKRDRAPVLKLQHHQIK